MQWGSVYFPESSHVENVATLQQDLICFFLRWPTLCPFDDRVYTPMSSPYLNQTLCIWCRYQFIYITSNITASWLHLQGKHTHTFPPTLWICGSFLSELGLFQFLRSLLLTATKSVIARAPNKGLIAPRAKPCTGHFIQSGKIPRDIIISLLQIKKPNLGYC